jgi:hypothetical protein
MDFLYQHRMGFGVQPKSFPLEHIRTFVQLDSDCAPLSLGCFLWHFIIPASVGVYELAQFILCLFVSKPEINRVNSLLLKLERMP